MTALEANSSSGTLFITWGPPANPNGRILNYSVSIINLSDGSILRKEKTLNTSVNQRDLGNHVVAIPILIMTFCHSLWSPVQCEYCSSEQGRSRRGQCVHSLHGGTR